MDLWSQLALLDQHLFRCRKIARSSKGGLKPCNSWWKAAGWGTLPGCVDPVLFHDVLKLLSSPATRPASYPKSLFSFVVLLGSRVALFRIGSVLLEVTSGRCTFLQSWDMEILALA